MYPGCQFEAWSGIEWSTCYTHHITCSVAGCGSTAILFSPAGQLCAEHMHQAEAIEMRGSYPSPRAIRAVWEP